jgi:hypothetical protein
MFMSLVNQSLQVRADITFAIMPLFCNSDGLQLSSHEIDVLLKVNATKYDKITENVNRCNTQ